MRLQPRATLAVLMWAVSLLTVFTMACGIEVEPPPPDDQSIVSEPSGAAPTEQAPTAVAAAPASPPPATPTVIVAAPAVASPVARSAAPDPASSAGNQRATTQATFLVSNTLGRGMALRTAPISREPGKVWPDGTRMVGLGAEQEAYGWTWRFVRAPDGNIGWMPSNYLVLDESAPAPVGNGTVQPPSAPPTLILVPTTGVPEPTVTAGPATRTVAGTPTPGASPAPHTDAPASIPQADGVLNTLRDAGARAGASLPGNLPSSLPSFMGGR
jgi:hypothetical protein